MSSFGGLLRQHRLQAGFTQEELARRANLSVRGISDLERGARTRPHLSTVGLLAAALDLADDERSSLLAAALLERQPEGAREAAVTEGDLPPMVGPERHAREDVLTQVQALLASMPEDALPERGVLPAGSRMPLRPNPLFVGRGEELLQLAARLKAADTTVALGQVVASTGLGGLGKTQLAVELIHRYGRFFAGGVFWLSFASAPEIPLQVAACAGPTAMDLAPGIETLPLEERVQHVQRAWQSAVPRLLVFDNCEEESLLEAWRPTSGGCRVLITSRRSRWSPTLGVTSLPLDLLPRLDSIELLRRYRPDLPAHEPGLDAIAGELGDLPLALHLAGSYLRTYHAEVTLDGYLTELRRSVVVQHASLLGAGLDDAPSPTRHVQNVAQTFALWLGRLDREREVDRIAIALLARMACMAPGEPVPRELLAGTLEKVEPLRRADGLRRLVAVGLVEEGEDWLRMHRLLVHFIRKEGLDPDAQPAVEQVLVECGRAASDRHLSWRMLSTVIPHLIHIASRDVDDEPRLVGIYGATGQTLLHAGDLHAAQPWLELAAEISERALASDHPQTVDSLTNLAELLVTQGRLADARNLCERVVAIRERVLGIDHLDTAESLNNLACVLRIQGELAPAKTLFERAHAIFERELGPDHPKTSRIMNNLGLLMWNQGDLAAAERVLQRALDIRERVLGADHPDTGNCLNNLALVLRDRGDLETAKAMTERAVSICERTLGPNHTSTANGLHNLARLHRAQGDLVAARPLFERALAIRERVLPPGHSATVTIRRELAELAAEGGGPAAGR